MRRVDSRCALLYEWLKYRVLYVCDKVVIFWLKNTTGVLVFLTHTNKKVHQKYLNPLTTTTCTRNTYVSSKQEKEGSVVFVLRRHGEWMCERGVGDERARFELEQRIED